MDPEIILIKIMIDNSNEGFDINTQSISTLKQIRQELQKLEINYEYVFLMKDRSIVSTICQPYFKFSMIETEKYKIYIRPIERNVRSQKIMTDIVTPEAIVKFEQKQLYQKFEWEIQNLRQRLQRMKKQYITKSNFFQKIDKFYLGQISPVGKYEGMGLYIGRNGESYKGEFKNGKRHGLGVYVYQNGDRFEGQYKDGLACGLGYQIYKNGDSIAAYYDQNNSNGIGIYYQSDGVKIMGQFSSNLLHGKAYRVFPDYSFKIQQYSYGRYIQS